MSAPLTSETPELGDEIVDNLATRRWLSLLIAAGRFGALLDRRGRDAGELVQLGVDVDAGIAVVVGGDQKECGDLGHGEGHYHAQVPREVTHTQVINDVTGEAITEGPTSVTFELIEPPVEVGSVRVPQTFALLLSNLRELDVDCHRVILAAHSVAVDPLLGLYDLAAAHLLQTLGQVFTVEQGLVLQPIPDCIEQTSGLSRFAKFAH